MMRKLAVLSVLVLLFAGVEGFSMVDDWEELSANVPVNETSISLESAERTGEVFLGTDAGLYGSRDFGEKWDKITLPGEKQGIKDIAFSGKDVFVVAGQRLYGKIAGKKWRYFSDKKSLKGIETG